MRLFIGISVPEDFKKCIAKLQDELESKGIELVPRQNLHFTLKFLGETDLNFLGKLEELSKRYRPFSIKMAGLGAFPSISNARVVWVGGESEGFVKLAEDIHQTLDYLRKEDYDDVKPHLTIARVSYGIVNSKFFDKKADFGSFDVSSFAVYQSILGKDGPVYEIVREFKLNN